MPGTSGRANRYTQILTRIFEERYTPGAMNVPFKRQDIVQVAADLGIDLPKNLGDVIYSFRYRNELPEAIRSKAPAGRVWIIRSTGRSEYVFASVTAETAVITPNPMLARIKVPDATPGVISRYAQGDEQALLARLRYNRLIDVFTGVACYSLQNHLRTTVRGIGQVETDEIYVGVDKHGAHYVFPVQAKGGRDSISVVQIEQDVQMCAEKFAAAICRPIAAQFMEGEVIALFAFCQTDEGIRVETERHYTLVSPAALSTEDIATYQAAAVRAPGGLH